MYVCLFWILSNKLDLNQETRFTIKGKSCRVYIWTNIPIWEWIMIKMNLNFIYFSSIFSWKNIIFWHKVRFQQARMKIWTKWQFPFCANTLSTIYFLWFWKEITSCKMLKVFLWPLFYLEWDGRRNGKSEKDGQRRPKERLTKKRKTEREQKERKRSRPRTKIDREMRMKS